MTLELILAVIGGVAVGVAMLVGTFICVWLLLYRWQYGSWWWDESGG